MLKATHSALAWVTVVQHAAHTRYRLSMCGTIVAHAGTAHACGLEVLPRSSNGVHVSNECKRTA